MQEVLGRLLDDMTVALTLKLAKVTPELGSKVLTMDEANVRTLCVETLLASTATFAMA